MSILRYFNKHEGWYDGKRTPFGGGGGGWNPIAAITDPISSALGTDGGGGGILGGLADIDPGPAIGQGLAEVDQGVNQIPGGWYTVGALGAGGTALAFAPEIMAAVGAEAGTTISSELGKETFFTALSNGATGSEAVSAGLAAESAAATGGAGAVADTVTQTPGADAILNAPNVTPSVAPTTTGSFGSITSPLTGSGAIPGAGATTLGGGGLTGALPAGVVVGDGTLGTTMGATYMATDSGGIATDLLGNPIPASSTGIGGFAPPSGLSVSDIASNANRLKNIAKLLTGSSGSGITGMSAPTAQQWSTQAGLNAAQATPQQFGGLYQMNKNPFTFQNPLANALKGKDTTGLDVSGTPGTSLNTSQQNQIYSSLLRS